MDGQRFAVTVHLHGTLSANAQGSFSLDGPATLVAISAVASNDSDATLQVGDAGDADGIMTATTIGDSGTPKVMTISDFNGALVDPKANGYHFPSNDKALHWLLDFDGAAGTAAQNVTIVFWFQDGGS